MIKLSEMDKKTYNSSDLVVSNNLVSSSNIDNVLKEKDIFLTIKGKEYPVSTLLDKFYKLCDTMESVDKKLDLLVNKEK